MLIKLFTHFLCVIFSPIKFLINFRRKILKKKILKGYFNSQSPAYFYALKELAWNKYHEPDFVLTEKLAQNLINNTKDKNEFPGKNNILANGYTLLGLLALTTSTSKAKHYLLKTASLMLFPKTKDLVLAQKLLNIGEYDTVQNFIKRYIKNIKSYDFPKFTRKHIASHIKQLEKYNTEIKQRKKPQLIIKN